MASKDQPVTFWGAIIIFWLLAAISAVAAVPMAVGVVSVALIPGVGELRSHDPWLWLNLLWMFPAFWVITTVIDAFLTFSSQEFSEESTTSSRTSSYGSRSHGCSQRSSKVSSRR